MNVMKNPFPNDPERNAIWELIVPRQLDAFLQQDFAAVRATLVPGFYSINAGGAPHAESWRFQANDLAAYQQQWEAQAAAFAGLKWAEEVRPALFRCTFLQHIDVQGDRALAVKRLAGSILQADGTTVARQCLTLCSCVKLNGVWKLAHIIDNLPVQGMPFGSSGTAFMKTLPSGVTAGVGPYSPVLKVRGQELVVISGQVPVDVKGQLVGAGDIAAQTRQTLENARARLQSAGVGFEHVFKVNVYLTDLALWPRFNELYKELMPQPLPARTAIGAQLLKGFLVEVDMWAMK